MWLASGCQAIYGPIACTSLMGRLALASTLVLCLAACGPRPDSTTAVERVLAEHARWAARTKRERPLLEWLATTTLPVAATPILRRVARMRSISLEGCPDDFREAWSQHLEAWDRAARAENQAASNAARSDIAATRRRLEAVAARHRRPPGGIDGDAGLRG